MTMPVDSCNLCDEGLAKESKMHAKKGGREEEQGADDIDL